MSAQQDDLGREYIVEYRAGQFQNGSLVLRFPGDPSERQIRDALIAYGLPSRALEQVRARPVSHPRTTAPSARPRPSQTAGRPGTHGTYDPATGREAWVSPAAGTSPTTSPPTGETDRTKKKGGCLGPLVGVVVVFFLGVGLFAQPAIDSGQIVGGFLPASANPATECFDGIADFTGGDEGLLSQFVSREPTQFPVTPANAAFYVSCVVEALT